MKKHFFLLLLVLFFSVEVIAQSFQYSYQGKTLTYTVTDQENRVCKVGFNTDATGTVVIPANAVNGSTTYTVTEIGGGAFSRSTASSITLPSTVTTVGNEAFYLCEATTITLGSYVKTIGNFAFQGADYLKAIIIPNSVVSIGEYAFDDCNSLESVQLGTSLESIGNYAFRFCPKLTSIEIPASVSSIGVGPFAWCKKLRDLSVSEDNDYFTVVDGVLFNKEQTTLIQYLSAKTVDSWGTPLNTEYIVPKTVTSIGTYAFYGCEGLSAIELPRSTTSLGYNVFGSCKNLRTVTSLAVEPPAIVTGTFDFSSHPAAKLYVPDDAVDSYRSANGWKSFTSIIGFANVDTVEISGLHYIMNHSTLCATVTYSQQNSLSNYEGYKTINIPESVNYDGMVYSVTEIGQEAFSYCWGLKGVVLPSTIQNIGESAFAYCTSLRTVEIPDAVTEIASEAFTGCSALASVTIGDSVEEIGDYAFFGCVGIGSLRIPSSVEKIGENAFMGVNWVSDVRVEAPIPADAPTTAFSANAYRNAILTVPNGSKGLYAEHPTWSNFATIQDGTPAVTGVENPSEAKISVLVNHCSVAVEGASSVMVYDSLGRLVYSGGSGVFELEEGLYIVVADGVLRKVKI